MDIITPALFSSFTNSANLLESRPSSVDKVIRRDIFLLSLLAEEQLNILNKLVRREKEIWFQDFLRNSSFNISCIFQDKHWILKVIQYLDLISLKDHTLNTATYDKLKLLRFLDLTATQSVIELPSSLSEYSEDLFIDDISLQRLVIKVKQYFSIINLCDSFTKDITSVFNESCTSYMLDTLSNHINLLETSKWPLIASALEENDKLCAQYMTNNQCDIFKTFMVFVSLIGIKAACKEELQKNIINDVKTKLLSIKNKFLILYFLEDIFSAIFLTEKDMCDKTYAFDINMTVIEVILKVIKEVIGVIILDIPVNIKESLNALNKHVSDAMWRLDLIQKLKKNKLKTGPQLLRYLVAHPLSLLTMCMQKGNIIEAHEVVRVFGLEKTPLAKELNFTTDLLEIYTTCRKLDDMPQSKENCQNEATQENLISKLSEKIENLITFGATENCLHQKTRQENIMNILFTQSFNVEMSKLVNIHQVTNMPNKIDFCENIKNLYRVVSLDKNISLCELILSPISFDIKAYTQQQKFDLSLISTCDEFLSQLNSTPEGFLNPNHMAHKIYSKIISLCKIHVGNSSTNDYLSKLYTYLKTFIEVFYIGQNTSNIISKGKHISFFELLKYNRSEIMGEILFENQLNPSKFEHHFSKMKLDFLYHLVGNCFPTINLHTMQYINEEELFPENKLYSLNDNLLKYIMKRHLLLALILKEMYHFSDLEISVNDSRIRTFLNYRNLDCIKTIKRLFKDDEVVASLQSQISHTKIKSYLCGDYKSFNDGNISKEITDEAVQMKEDYVKSFELLQSLSEIERERFDEFKRFNDFFISVIISVTKPSEQVRFLPYVYDRKKRLQIVCDNFMKWTPEVALDVVRSELTVFCDQEDDVTENLIKCLKMIMLYDNLSHILHKQDWQLCQEVTLDNVQGNFHLLMQSSEVSQILRFLTDRRTPKGTLKLFNQIFFNNVSEKECPIRVLENTLDTLPMEQSICICNSLLREVSDMEVLNFILDYLVKHTKQRNLNQIHISLKILSKLPECDRERLLPLINTPIILIEILLMNCKFDILTIALETVREGITQEDLGVLNGDIDRVLRIYAEKYLDIRIDSHDLDRVSKTSDSKSIGSYDSLSSDWKSSFVPIETTPTREQWRRDSGELGCMCCQNVTFSMFNRKHHCRRCGRVVCASCSTNKMKVSSYGDVLVRVCKDCYRHSNDASLSDNKERLSCDKLGDYYWLLTDDEQQNYVIRSEFYYDNAPSVSHCLTILNNHSYNGEHPRFLIDQGEKMLKVLYSSKASLQRTDSFLVIKMSKALARTAKMLSQDMFQDNIPSAERLLLQADILELFFQRGNLSFLSSQSKAFSQIFTNFNLRRLRESLFELEEWELALEISTKGGLDKTAVFANWGKSCLRAGCLSKARKILQLCFEGKTTQENYIENNSDDNDSINSSVRSLNKSVEWSFKKPQRSSPLLNEIIDILEEKSTVIDKIIVDEVFSHKSSNQSLNQEQPTFAKDPAVSILNKLRNLDVISSGKYYFASDRKTQMSYAANRPVVDIVFYNECIFYLRNYGSHQSLLEFYLKHGELDQALQYVLDNNTSCELFVEIYMSSLKKGMVNIFQENLLKIDSTLELWKSHLQQLCRHLEQQKLLNSLYQLQLFMGDYMRAAITCIRFYQENSNTFNDLARKSNFLHKAEEHVKQLNIQEEQSEEFAGVDIEKTNIRKSLSDSSLVMKILDKDANLYLNLIWRQNELVSFLADCEALGIQPTQILSNILSEGTNSNISSVPTLFGNYKDKIRLTILILVISTKVEAGFKIVSRLINDLNLNHTIVYQEAVRYLAARQEYKAISVLVQNITSDATRNEIPTDVYNALLIIVIEALTKHSAPTANINEVINLITNQAAKISAYIAAKQLKTAFLYAVRYKRYSDIKIILREAESNNQPEVKSLCEKALSKA